MCFCRDTLHDILNGLSSPETTDFTAGDEACHIAVTIKPNLQGAHNLRHGALQAVLLCRAAAAAWSSHLKRWIDQLAQTGKPTACTCQSWWWSHTALWHHRSSFDVSYNSVLKHVWIDGKSLELRELPIAEYLGSLDFRAMWSDQQSP